MRSGSVERATAIVGHLAPDLDCLVAIWILMRFGGAADAELHFVPAGTTLHGLPADANPAIIHVDTGGGRYDHHQRNAPGLCAAELVRRAHVPYDEALERLVRQVVRIDHAVERASDPGFFSIQALINGYHLLFPDAPQQVASAMLLNLDAWYTQEARQLRLEAAFAKRVEFETPWGMGIAMESDDGGSSRLAYGLGAVLYAYRDRHGWMGIAAQSRSNVDLSHVYTTLQRIDQNADWYLHPNRRLLLCGTPKAPPRVPSQLTLTDLVRVIQGDTLISPH